MTETITDKDINKAKNSLSHLLLSIEQNPSRLPVKLAMHLTKFEKKGLVISTRNKKGHLILKATSKLKAIVLNG